MSTYRFDDSEVQQGLDAYYNTVLEALHAVGEYYAPLVEAYAKQNAPWTDRSGNARQGLAGLIEDLSETSVALYLKHGMNYGIWLELKNQGRYAIILPTLEAHYAAINGTLQQVFGK